MDAEGWTEDDFTAALRTASMEPHPVGCGRASGKITTTADAALQWSRILLDAEGWPWVDIEKEVKALQWSRILLDAEGYHKAFGRSQSPRFNGAASCWMRKGGETGGGAARRALLQWSRILLDAEGQWSLAPWDNATGLQWSRILLDAEGLR